MYRNQNYGGSGLRGLARNCKLGSGVGVGIGRSKEESLAFRNKPSFPEASSDWRITGSRHGRGINLLLSLAYCEH